MGQNVNKRERHLAASMTAETEQQVLVVFCKALQPKKLFPVNGFHTRYMCVSVCGEDTEF